MPCGNHSVALALMLGYHDGVGFGGWDVVLVAQAGGEGGSVLVELEGALLVESGL